MKIRTLLDLGAGGRRHRCPLLGSMGNVGSFNIILLSLNRPYQKRSLSDTPSHFVTLVDTLLLLILDECRLLYRTFHWLLKSTNVRLRSTGHLYFSHQIDKEHKKLKVTRHYHTIERPHIWLIEKNSNMCWDTFNDTYCKDVVLFWQTHSVQLYNVFSTYTLLWLGMRRHLIDTLGKRLFQLKQMIWEFGFSVLPASFFEYNNFFGGGGGLKCLKNFVLWLRYKYQMWWVYISLYRVVWKLTMMAGLNYNRIAKGGNQTVTSLLFCHRDRTTIFSKYRLFERPKMLHSEVKPALCCFLN